MAGLITAPNIDDPDAVYAALLAAHDGLDDDQSAALNARLVLILANHVGDRSVITDAIDAARRAGPPREGDAQS